MGSTWIGAGTLPGRTSTSTGPTLAYLATLRSSTTSSARRWPGVVPANGSRSAAWGGHGRTGTALACLARLDGVPAGDAVAWVREHYCRQAVETVDQEAFVLGQR